MSAPNVQHSLDLQKSFSLYDQQVTINNIQLGCLLGMILMPAGVVLDWFMYREQVLDFFLLRLLCSGLIGVFWAFVRSPLGRANYRTLGVVLAMLPALFITAIMFNTPDGGNSPYYAGLNLVLLVVGYILHWSVAESIAACSMVMFMYLVACLWNNVPLQLGYFSNNIYFLVLTAIIVVAGSYHHSRLRFNEFALRFELDKNRQQLEQNNQKLMEMDEVKSRFFANISHELRTPLTLLLAPMESLVAQGKRSFNADTNELLATMQANGMRLLKLINDLLDLVRLDSGRMEVRKEPIDVEAFVKGLVQSVRKVAQDKKLNLQTEVAEEVGTVMADRDKWEKILLNLVFNAIKFTPARGTVGVKVTKEGEQLVIVVRDTGMGIAKENLENVFGRFWQADTSAKRKFQGAGIGLALVKELVEVQEGTVSLESELDKGTTITLRFPYQKGEAPALVESRNGPATTVPEPSDEWLTGLYRRAELFPSVTLVQETMRPFEQPARRGAQTVLVADDEPDMLKFLRSQLSPLYHVIEAVDGLQAYDKAAQFMPDLVLLDMMMPEKDGLQVCRELRARTSTRRIPIVLLTARADEDTKLTALAAGASDFLSKPFSTTELQVRVKNLIESHEYQRKLTKQNQILESTIQQLKETELQLVQSEKLASLGRMSAGIIHEINNPLNFAKTAVHMLKRQGQKLPAEERDEFADMLKDIEEGIDRVRIIVTDLRAFTHPNMENFEEVSLKQVVTSALRFLSHEWKEKVEIIEDYDEGQVVWGNRHQLIQVVLNLLQNALDALKKKDFGPDKPVVKITGVVDEHRFVLSIRDNGPGIDPETLARVFDPFFTTKDVGEGMGLGLSICYKIMESHEGKITVQSEPGKFCEFRLEFPLPVRELVS